MKVYGYLRVSSDEQDVNNQKSGVVTFAESKGWKIDEWITDEGVSGTKDPKKRNLGGLIGKCQSGDVIVCSELSRLGRKMLMVMSILEHCMKNGIVIHTVKDNYTLGDNIQSSVLAFAFSLAAQIERDMIAMRTKEALAVRKKEGVLLGSPRAKRVVRVHPDEVEKMVKMVEAGKTITAIASEMGYHRITIGYYLCKNANYKGRISGYEITYFNDKKTVVTKKNAAELGLYYCKIKNAANGGADLSGIGILKIEPVYQKASAEFNEEYCIKKSENPKIKRSELENMLLNDFTMPQIFANLSMSQEDLTYDEVYDYIAQDTYLSIEYRKHGQLKCKKKDKY